MLDNIPFLLLLGVLFPTGLYTVWSVLELRDLQHFSEAPAGALHGSAAIGQGATTAAAEPVAPAAVADGVRVVMRGLAFQTKRLEITAGTSVTWVNEDPFDHAVAYGDPDLPADQRLFEGSGDFGQGGTFTQRFDAPGVHPIYCSTPGHFAAGMTMTVVVTEAQR